MRSFYFIRNIILICLTSMGAHAQVKNITNKAIGNITVLELFTSEGCSSCPAADKILSEIQHEYNGKVLVLGYHIDYWNSLGWKDAFSLSKNTDRQQYYAGIFHLNSNYTPQVVANGSSEFVGSDRSKILAAIQNNEHSTAGNPITINAAETGNELRITTHIEEALRGYNMIICLLQREATTNVKRGENGGRLLHHINVVRDYKQLNIIGKEQNAIMTIPTGLKKADVFIAAFSQNSRTGAITAVAMSEIN